MSLLKSYKYKLLKLNEIKTHSEQQVAQTYVAKFLVTDSQSDCGPNCYKVPVLSL